MHIHSVWNKVISNGSGCRLNRRNDYQIMIMESGQTVVQFFWANRSRSLSTTYSISCTYLTLRCDAMRNIISTYYFSRFICVTCCGIKKNIYTYCAWLRRPSSTSRKYSADTKTLPPFAGITVQPARQCFTKTLIHSYYQKLIPRNRLPSLGDPSDRWLLLLQCHKMNHFRTHNSTLDCVALPFL